MELEEMREEVGETFEKGETREKWLSYLALTTVILAVCASLSSFKENNNSVDTVLNQTQASDQWAFYQAKSIKGYLYEMQKEKVELDLTVFGRTFSDDASGKLRTTVESYDKKMKKYDQEKAEVMKEAKNFEKLRDDAQRRQDTYGIAVIFLQMGILLCSISALMKRRLLWLAGGMTGAVGVVYFANGFLLFM
ncbi:MAG: DUF4337 domain-containing protein [Desulfomonile tiedjei]|nr:DUF4337 domain-containing protein [Desulfomonile tiedjei]